MQDLLPIQSKLNNELFSSSQEKCLSLCRVQDLGKASKKKSLVLCACIYEKSDPRPTLHLVRLPEKSNEFPKKKNSNLLRDIKMIDFAPSNAEKRQSSNVQFDLKTSDQEFSYATLSFDEKKEFIVALRKMTAYYLKHSNEKPRFINFPQEEEDSINAQNVETNTNKASQNESWDAITQEEERDLTNLMSEYDFAIKDAERFVDMLQQRLTDLDVANVETVMASEKGAVQLMNMLDKAVDEISKIDSRLGVYEKKLSNVADAVKIMSQKDSLIQVETGNIQKLTGALENLLEMQDFPDEYIRLLQNSDLTNDQDRNLCIQAATLLNQALSFQLQPGMEKMTAIRQRRDILEQTQKAFTLRCRNFLDSKFSFHAQDYGDRFELGGNELPKHNEKILRPLLQFSPLCHWLKTASNSHFNDVCQKYIHQIRPIYAKEIHGFFESARLGVNKGVPTNQEKRNVGSVPALNTIRRDRDKQSGQSASGGSAFENDPFSMKNSTKEFRTRCDKIFERVLAQVVPIVREEQTFCVNFFNFLEEETISGENAADGPENVTNYSSSRLKQMLSELFEPLDGEIKSLISHIKSIDPLIVLYLFVRMSESTIAVQNFGSFLNKLYAGNLILVKREVDAYIAELCNRIGEFRPVKNRRVGILPFVNFFGDFSEEAEVIFDKSARVADLHRVYKNLVSAIFRGIDHCGDAMTNDSKTPSSMVKLENYHQMQHIMGLNRLTSLDAEKQTARKNYAAAKTEYEREYCGFPFEKLHTFFERVDELRKRLGKDEDVQFQSDCSIIELRQLVRNHPPKEVKRGLEMLYKKIEKHLSDNSSLMQAIWHDIQTLVIEEYQRMNDLINRCYPNSNIHLEFSVEDLLKFFTETAHSSIS